MLEKRASSSNMLFVLFVASQHWEIYKKWNEKLFYEMYLSFKDGRTDVDPSSGWYKGKSLIVVF
jgi:hypothetical protein